MSPHSGGSDLNTRYSASPRTRTLVDELLEAVVGGVFVDRGDEETMAQQTTNDNNEYGESQQKSKMVY